MLKTIVEEVDELLGKARDGPVEDQPKVVALELVGVASDMKPSISRWCSMFSCWLTV